MSSALVVVEFLRKNPVVLCLQFRVVYSNPTVVFIEEIRRLFFSLVVPGEKKLVSQLVYFPSETILKSFNLVASCYARWLLNNGNNIINHKSMYVVKDSCITIRDTAFNVCGWK